MENITVKEVIIVTPKTDLFIGKRSIIKAIKRFINCLLKRKELSNEEIIYNYLANKYNIQ